MAQALMCRFAMSLWAGLTAIVLAALIIGTAQAAEPAHTLPDNGLLRIGNQLISLYGVNLPAPDQMCEDGGVLWSCGTASHVCLVNKKTCLLVDQEDISSCGTSRHIFL